MTTLPDRGCLTHVVTRPILWTSLLGGGSNVAGLEKYVGATYLAAY